MNGARDLDSFGTGRDNGNRGRLAREGLRTGADSVDRALCLAGFETARIARGIGSFPVLLHKGRRALWLVGDDGPPGTTRPVYQATESIAARPGPAVAGYYNLRALFRLIGESQA